MVANKFIPSFTIITLFLILALTGLALIPFIPFQLLPNAPHPSITVSYQWPNASNLALEQEVTSILEGSFSSLKGIKDIHSESSNEKGSISLTFNDEADIKIAQFEVSSIIRNQYSLLPKGLQYPNINIGGKIADQQPMIVYSILTPINFPNLQKIIDEKIVRKLSRIEGVEKVDAFVNNISRLSVKYDVYKMELFNIKSSQIRDIIMKGQTKYPLGKIAIKEDHVEKEIGVLIEGGWKNNHGLEALPLTIYNGRVIRLRDIAIVKLEEVKPLSYYRINSANTNSLILYAHEGVNQLATVSKIKQSMEEIEKSLPESWSFLLINDPSQYIKDELFNISWRAGLTLFLLLLLVFIASRSYKQLLIIVIGLFANLAIALLFYYLLGVELHLFSLAGITVSFGFLIDSCIIMIDHIRYKNNKKVFLAVLASCLTTIASLSVIFLLSERLKLNLVDFVKVIMINLSISLFVVFFLIPALIEKIGFETMSNQKQLFTKKRKIAAKLSGIYFKIILFLARYKVAFLLIIALGFGLPVFLLPMQINNEEGNVWTKLYNQTLGSDFYNKTLRMPTNMILGGSLRLFIEKVEDRNYFAEKQHTILIVKAYMPQGATLDQMNEVFLRLEIYLKQFKEIEKFEASVFAGQGKMVITFKPEFEFSMFPYFLKEQLTHQAISLGSTDWEVFGVGDGFNNVTLESTGSFKIKLVGYNYDQLMELAQELKVDLLRNDRIKKVNISDKEAKYRKINEEFILEPNEERLGLITNSFSNIFKDIKILSGQNEYAGWTNYEGEYKEVSMSSSYGEKFNKWNLNNDIIYSKGSFIKLSQLSSFKKQEASSSISKTNQNFHLYLDYNFIGPDELGSMHLVDVLLNFKQRLPIGYAYEINNKNSLNKKEKTEQNLSILLIVLIIFFICAVLFESIKQPLIIIMIIPFNFIGVFLTYYLFNIGFNQGGYAALVILSGLTVNSAIYIINEINNIRKRFSEPFSGDPLKSAIRNLRIYIQAFNSKIIPIVLSILSTILGLIPFLIDGHLDKFWKTLVTGTIGGLLFSIIAIYFYMPLFLIKKSDAKIINKLLQRR